MRRSARAISMTFSSVRSKSACQLIAETPSQLAYWLVGDPSTPLHRVHDVLARQTLEGDGRPGGKREFAAGGDEFAQEGGDEDVAAGGLAGDARREDDVSAVEVVPLTDGLAGVEAS